MVRTENILVSYFLSFPWSPIKSAVSESADFNFLSILKLVLAGLPPKFFDLFDEATYDTVREDAITVLRAIYMTPSEVDRVVDAIIADCVRALTYRLSDEEGSSDAAYELGIIFIEE